MLQNTRASKVSIQQVPTEILGNIFSLTAEPGSNVVGHDRITVPGLNLAAVCSRWRSLALSTQDLWSTIESQVWDTNYPIDLEDSTQRITEVTKFLLKHSGSHCLDVTMVRVSQEPEYDPIVSDDPGWSLILPECSRWRSLTIVGNLCSIPEDFSTVAGRLPLLESIEISTEDNWEDDEVLDTASLDFLRETPRLHTVSLEGVACSLKLPVQWKQLHSVTLRGPINLTAQEDGLEVLSRCSDITEAYIRGGEETQLSTPVVLDKLHSLDLRKSRMTLANHMLALNSLILPALTSLSIGNLYYFTSPQSPDDFAFSLDTFLLQSQCTITTLCFENMPLVKVADWLAMLTSLPSLQNLSHYHHHCRPELHQLICDAFFEKLNSTPSFLPKLERLSVYVTYPAIFSAPEVFTNAIEAHWIPNSLRSDTEIACLKYLNFVLPEAHIEPEVIRVLQRLTSAGMIIAIKDATGFVVG
ncbi:hypothetical protein C8J56DRAFT_1050662 [Mycena floridula]|nr:hypothetical protein C8J56DRAFT_1050662 [Mycena floridula]